jgi:hypothetical protein
LKNAMPSTQRTGSGPQRITETSDYVAMMTRIITAFGDRIAADPAALAHLRDLQDDLTDQVNRGIFEANKGQYHYSQNEMAAVLGISRQAIAKRIRQVLPSSLFEHLAAESSGDDSARLHEYRKEPHHIA